MTGDAWAYAPGSDLPGGFIKAIARIGDTVHRPVDANAEFVHELLLHLERCGFEGAPRFLGHDDEGREVLSYIEGHVAWDAEQPISVRSDESLAGVGRLIRRVHDLTARTPLAGDRSVVCHNDLSPKNTVYRELDGAYHPIAFIDWDGAAPGVPEEDIARLLWQFVLTVDQRDSPDAVVPRMRVVLDAYAYAGDRRRLVGLIERNMQETLAGIKTRAESGLGPYQRLVEMGALDYIAGDLAWLRKRGSEIEAGLSAPPNAG